MKRSIDQLQFNEQDDNDNDTDRDENEYKDNKDSN